MPRIALAERLPDGSLRLLFEIAPATPIAEAITRDFTFGKDVPEDVAVREATLLIAAEYVRPEPVRVAKLEKDVGVDVSALVAGRQAEADAATVVEATVSE